MSYVTNSPKPDNVWEGDGDHELLRVYVLPAWIYRAFTSKYNLMEIHTLAKLRDVASAADVAHISILANRLMEQPEMGNPAYGWHCPADLVFECSKQREVTEEGQRELQTTIQAYVRDPQNQKALWSRLRDVPKENEPEALCCDDSYPRTMPPSPEQQTQPPYRIVLLQGELYIIVEEGFLSRMCEGTAKAAFFTDVLKSAYAVAPISVVNRSVWYRQYVAALPA